MDDTVAVDYHLHTTYTDGGATVQQMAEAAVSRGITEVLFSEHVRHTSTYFASFAGEVQALQYPGLNAYVGVETKICDLDGNLDCSSQIASACDAIIGSVHSPPLKNNGEVQGWSQFDAETAVELEFHLALAIVAKSQAHILGHPMGMVITRLGLRPLDCIYKLACACRDSDKAFELNVRYCPAPEDWVKVVRHAGCKVSFGSDAHKTTDVGAAWHLFMHKEMHPL
jgi:putative hydrolase